MARGVLLLALTALLSSRTVWAVSKAFTNPEMLAQVEHDTEEFHRATQEQNGLKQQYIELLEAMGIPVTDELLQASGRRKLLQAPNAAAARAARQRAARQAQVTPAQLVDALKSRLAAYDEYVAMKAQVASLARLYQATSPAFRLDMGTCSVTEKGGCIESRNAREGESEASHCMWVALKDVKLTTLDWSMEPVDGTAPCPDYGSAVSAHECLFSLVVNGKVYSSAQGRPDAVFVEANSRIDLYRDSKIDYQGNVKVCDGATDLVHEPTDMV